MIDMSPVAVDRRLRQVSKLEQAVSMSPERLAYRQHIRSMVRREPRERPVPMTPEAVDARLREVSEMLKLCVDLRRAVRRE